MPALTFTPTERQSRAGIARLNGAVHDSARRTLRHEERRSNAEKARQRLESAHPEWSGTDLRRATGHLLVMLPIFGAYGLDVLFFGPTVEYLVTSSGWTDPSILTAARLVVPALFICLDLGLAILIAEARQRARDVPLPAQRWPLCGWGLAGLLLNGAVVGFVMGTQRANLLSSGLPKEVALPILIGATALACLCHALILFGGEPLAEAKAHLTFTTKRGRYGRAAERHSRRARARARGTMDCFRVLSQRLEEHNQQYRDRPFLPVFDREVRELINREADRPLIRYDREPEQPADGQCSPSPDGRPSARGPQPRMSGTSGDQVAEDLGTFVEERRRREADGEVRL